MVEAWISPALGLHRLRVAHHMAGLQGLPIHHRHHRIHPRARAYLRPAESGHKGLRKRQTTGFHHDPIELIRPLEQKFHRGQELLLHGAAEAAIGQLHDAPGAFLLRAEAAAGDQVPIDAHLAEFIDQHGQTATAVEQQAAQEGGLPSSQKAGDHGYGQAARARRGLCCGRRCR